MSTLKWLDATDLNLWANRRDSQDKLPLVLRRLILAIGQDISRISFPSGDSVQLGGWDGIVVADEEHIFVPEGTSVWELGSNRSVKSKADSDYKKRCENPLGVDPTKTTFIFVTPRRWGQKDKWVKQRNEEGFWAEVRAYDADDLEAWLEIAPAVQAWLARILGKYPQGASALDSAWDEWRYATNPPLDIDIVLAGRKKLGEELTKWIEEPSSSALTIQSGSRDESLAFFSATVFQLEQEKRITILARCVVVEDQNAWKHLVATNERLILIPTYDNLTGVAYAARHGHQILIPVGKESHGSGHTIKLQRQPRPAVESALVKMGYSSQEAYSIVSETKRSLPVLRRHLADISEIHAPIWARPENAGPLISILLAGAWDSSNKSDQEVIEQLARESYDQVERTLTRWANKSDSPVRKVGAVWQLVSREDSWNLLWRFVSEQDLNLFHDVALSVLSELDPRYELPAEERLFANIYGKVLRNSELLRKGIAETLALIGARGKRDSNESWLTAQQRADRLVHSLLSQANDWKLWASLSNLLPLLAEASPNMFLAAIEKYLQGDQSVLLGMFADEGLMGGSAHTGLLWALETFAWEPDYLSRASIILARLASIDPGGELANRPQNSLREIFLSWRPQTPATLEQRLAVLDTIMSKEPNVAWNLLIHPLSKGTRGVSTPIHKPEWRDWGESWEPSMTRSEYFRQIEQLFQRALNSVGTSGERWCSLVETISSLPQPQRDILLEELSTLHSKLKGAKDRLQVWEKLRAIINRHRKFPNASWAMPVEIVDRLYEAYQRLTPTDLVNRYSWLFSSRPSLLRPPLGYNRRAEGELLEAVRLEAVNDIYSKEGFSRLISLAQQVKNPSSLGFILGKSSFGQSIEIDLLDNGLQENNSNLLELAGGFISYRFYSTGWEWVEELLLNQRRDEWSPWQKAQVLHILPCEKRTWNLAVNLGLEAEKEYWKEVSNYCMGKQDLPEELVACLLKHDRPYSAIQVASYCKLGEYSNSVSPNLIATILEYAVVKESKEEIAPHKWDLSAYEISELFQVLYEAPEVNRSRIISLEWAYLPILTNQEEYTPRLLTEELCNNPAFFSMMIAFVFKSTNEEDNLDRDSEEAATRAKLAYELLFSWKQMPGSKSDGSVDPNQLMYWVLEARRACQASGRLSIGDLQIGQILAYSPQGSDKNWPHEAVRDLLEGAGSKDIEDGMFNGLINKRGVSVRSPFEGGIQERELAASYRNHATAVRDKWPRTAALLRRIATHYDHDARWEDIEAELRD